MHVFIILFMQVQATNSTQHFIAKALFSMVKDGHTLKATLVNDHQLIMLVI